MATKQDDAGASPESRTQPPPSPAGGRRVLVSTPRAGLPQSASSPAASAAGSGLNRRRLHTPGGGIQTAKSVASRVRALPAAPLLTDEQKEKRERERKSRQILGALVGTTTGAKYVLGQTYGPKTWIGYEVWGGRVQQRPSFIIQQLRNPSDREARASTGFADDVLAQLHILSEERLGLFHILPVVEYAQSIPIASPPTPPTTDPLDRYLVLPHYQCNLKLIWEAKATSRYTTMWEGFFQRKLIQLLTALRFLHAHHYVHATVDMAHVLTEETGNTCALMPSELTQAVPASFAGGRFNLGAKFEYLRPQLRPPEAHDLSVCQPLHALDIWQLGMMCADLLSLKSNFSEDVYRELMAHNPSNPSLRELFEDLDPGLTGYPKWPLLANLVSAMLRFKPCDRESAFDLLSHPFFHDYLLLNLDLFHLVHAPLILKMLLAQREKIFLFRQRAATISSVRNKKDSRAHELASSLAQILAKSVLPVFPEKIPASKQWALILQLSHTTLPAFLQAHTGPSLNLRATLRRPQQQHQQQAITSPRATTSGALTTSDSPATSTMQTYSTEECLWKLLAAGRVDEFSRRMENEGAVLCYSGESGGIVVLSPSQIPLGTDFITQCIHEHALRAIGPGRYSLDGVEIATAARRTEQVQHTESIESELFDLDTPTADSGSDDDDGITPASNEFPLKVRLSDSAGQLPPAEKTEDVDAAERLRQAEVEKERQRVELDEQKQQLAEQLARLNELEKRRLAELEEQRLAELERQRQVEEERQRLAELERRRIAELEQERARDQEKYRALELQRQHSLNELEQQLKAEQQELEEVERQRCKSQQEAERLKSEMEKLKMEVELERQRQADLERQHQLEMEKQREADAEKQRLTEQHQREVAEKQRLQDELERQRLERERLEQQLEQEKQQLLELEAQDNKRLQEELERQRKVDEAAAAKLVEDLRREKAEYEKQLLHEQQQKELRLQAEREQQLAAQRELERQQQEELERRRLAEIERQEQLAALELQRKELQRKQTELENQQRAAEAEQRRLLELERQKQQDIEVERQRREAELERQRQEAELERQRKEAELERQRKEAELERQRQEAELERQQKEAEVERQRKEAELERQRQEAELERQQKEAELERQQKDAEVEQNTAAQQPDAESQRRDKRKVQAKRREDIRTLHRQLGDYEEEVLDMHTQFRRIQRHRRHALEEGGLFPSAHANAPTAGTAAAPAAQSALASLPALAVKAFLDTFYFDQSRITNGALSLICAEILRALEQIRSVADPAQNRPTSMACAMEIWELCIVVRDLIEESIDGIVSPALFELVKQRVQLAAGKHALTCSLPAVPNLVELFDCAEDVLAGFLEQNTWLLQPVVEPAALAPPSGQLPGHFLSPRSALTQVKSVADKPALSTAVYAGARCLVLSGSQSDVLAVGALLSQLVSGHLVAMICSDFASYVALQYHSDNLRERFAKVHPSWEQARALLLDVAIGLHFLHSRSVAHGHVDLEHVWFEPGQATGRLALTEPAPAFSMRAVEHDIQSYYDVVAWLDGRLDPAADRAELKEFRALFESKSVRSFEQIVGHFRARGLLVNRLQQARIEMEELEEKSAALERSLAVKKKMLVPLETELRELQAVLAAAAVSHSQVEDDINVDRSQDASAEEALRDEVAALEKQLETATVEARELPRNQRAQLSVAREAHRSAMDELESELDAVQNEVSATRKQIAALRKSL